MDNINRKDCPCPQGYCLAMTSDVFRCRKQEERVAATQALNMELFNAGRKDAFSDDNGNRRFMAVEMPAQACEVEDPCDGCEGTCVHDDPVKVMTEADRVQYVRNLMKAALNIARDYGCIVTIENKPLRPLAMGHYESVVDVRVRNV
jgi:hypothetical protein